MELLSLNQRPTAIVNPVSGRGKTYRNWGNIKTFLRRKFKDIKERFTEAPKHAIEIAKEEIRRGTEHLISVGGDGTLNEVVNGCFEGGFPINPEVKVSVFPSGRGNDFSRSLKIRRGNMDFSKSLKIDLVDMGDKFFINVLDLGLGGEIVKRLSRKEGAHSGIAYSFSLLKEFFKYQPKEYIIRTGREEIKGKFLTVIVANGTTFGGGMKIAPEASVSDGFLEVIAVREMSPMRFLLSLWRLYTGKLLSHPKVIHRRVKSLEIETREQFGEYDGELFSASKLWLKVKTGALGLLV